MLDSIEAPFKRKVESLKEGLKIIDAETEEIIQKMDAIKIMRYNRSQLRPKLFGFHTLTSLAGLLFVLFYLIGGDNQIHLCYRQTLK